jgi:hypothetical protein
LRVEDLLMLFKKLIKNIIWDVKLRLVDDAVKDGLIKAEENQQVTG